MAHFSYTAGRGGTAGDWPTEAAVTSAEFAWFAASIVASINGDGGGTYAPSSAIIIGGAGCQFADVSTLFYGIQCTGLANLAGDTVIGTNASNTLLLKATGTISGPQTFTNDNAFNGTVGTPRTTTFNAYSTLVLNGAFYSNVSSVLDGDTTIGTTSGDTLTVNATSTFTSDVTIGNSSGDDLTVVATVDVQNSATLGSSYTDTLTVNATSTFGSAVTLNGNATSTSAFTRGTGCRYQERLLFVDNDDVSVAAGTYDIVYMTASSSARTLTLTNSPVWLDGESITVRCASVGEVHVVGPGFLSSYLNSYEWIRLTWNDANAEFLPTGGGTVPYHGA
jgi:hypothetical protein